jgi:epoxyqueuosine reductase
MTPEEIKQQVLTWAQELGFQTCRMAVAQRARHAEAYDQWLADGCHGDMAWMARTPERRADPGLVVPGARTVIMVGLSYAPPEEPPLPAGHGVIARYAWGSDYHDLMEPRLAALTDKMKALGSEQRVYVDTGPVLERDFATESGLGWSGKSTVQISQELGTWFFLGTIITTLELPPDDPVRNRCGTCTRCLVACPTQAITQPHRVDARRCISYLTIEHKGPIPLEFRRAIGARIYGCDDCLSVCPWNKFAQKSREAFFHAREYVHHWPLRQFLTLDDDGFRFLFHGSPIKRTKRSRFLRNVCVALGNVGTNEDLPSLRAAAEGDDPLIAEHAAWAIQEIAHRTAPGPDA